MKVEKFKKDIEGSFTDLKKGKMKKKVKFNYEDKFTMPMWTCRNVLYLISQAVKNLGEGESYLNYGVWQGATLLIPAYFNKDKRCDGVDNFLSSHWGGSNEDRVRGSIAGHDLKNVNLYVKHYRDFLSAYPLPASSNPKYGVAFMDGDHTYELTLDALNLVVPCMAEKSVIILDDISEEEGVKKAMKEWLPESGYKMLWELPLVDKEKKIWWSGISVLQRGMKE